MTRITDNSGLYQFRMSKADVQERQTMENWITETMRLNPAFSRSKAVYTIMMGLIQQYAGIASKTAVTALNEADIRAIVRDENKALRATLEELVTNPQILMRVNEVAAEFQMGDYDPSMLDSLASDFEEHD